MGTLRRIAFAVLLISFVTFIALFGRLPALRNTPIGFLHRFIWVHIPKFIQSADRRLSGGRFLNNASRIGHYLAYEQNPVVLILFLMLLTGSILLFLFPAWGKLNQVNHVVIILLVPLPYIFTYLSASSLHSQIHSGNHAQQLRVYPYDHTLYYPGRYCSTCGHLKPPRSKHCSICRACVARHDHHCVWVNNCLGQENYRWFLGLLASLSCILPYGATLAFLILREKSANKLLVPTSKGPKGMFDRFAIVLASDARIGGVGLLAGLTAPLAWALFAYHVYLIWAGTTTNETLKWDDLKEDMAAGLVFKGSRQAMDTVAVIEPPTSWPNVSNQLIILTEDGENPAGPSRDTEQSRSGGEENQSQSFERCWRLGELVNVYDLGFWDNARDALYTL